MERTGLSSWKDLCCIGSDKENKFALNGGVTSGKRAASQPFRQGCKEKCTFVRRQARTFPKGKTYRKRNQKAKYSDRSLVQSLGQTVRVWKITGYTGREKQLLQDWSRCDLHAPQRKMPWTMGRQSLPITFKLRQRINIGRISPFYPNQQTPWPSSLFG